MQLNGRRSILIRVVLLSAALGRMVHAEETISADSVGARLFTSGEIPASVVELRAMEALQRQVGQRAINCTVSLKINMAQGSGVIISEDGYVLTAAHVAQRPGEKVIVTLAEGRRVEGVTLGLNRNSDAGLIKISGEGKWPYLEMADSDEVKEGQWCIATGHPGGLERERKPVMRVGRILSKTQELLVTDCALVGGDSGGPLVDGRGRVIGIHSRIGTQLTANMHIPVSRFEDHWERLVSREAWGHLPGQAPFLGVQADSGSGKAKIGKVYKGTPAEKSGILVGDVVTEIDGKAITDFPSLTASIAEYQAGDRVKIRLMRGSKTIEIEVTLERRNS